jgi:hypothetical protein
LVGARLPEVIDSFLLGLGQLPEVDVWCEHGEPMVGQLIAEVLDRGRQPPQRMQEQDPGTRFLTLHEVCEVAWHMI